MELGKAQVEQPRVPNLVLTHQAQVELGKAQVKVGNLPDRLSEEGRHEDETPKSGTAAGGDSGCPAMRTTGGARPEVAR